MKAASRLLFALALALAFAVPRLAAAQAPAATEFAPPIPMGKIGSPIRIDGDLSDAGWRGAAKVDTWYETNPGDNVAAPGPDVGYLGYDDRFLYAASSSADPIPRKIRAPYGDRDNVLQQHGLRRDHPRHARNDRRPAILFLATPAGIQYDAITDDATGEDSAPDFFWDSAARITPEGWVLEMRIPFSSLRYPKEDPQTWGIMLYRNYPRDFRYQIFRRQAAPRRRTASSAAPGPSRASQGLPARRPPGDRAVRQRRSRTATASGRPGHPAPERVGRGRRGARREVDAEREHRPRRHA